MTREQLESYKSMKEEISELKYKMQQLWESDSMMGFTTINDYRSGYPVPQAVVGVDREKYNRLRDRYTSKIAKLEEECLEIEEYVEGIQDSMTRRIFRLYFLESLPQDKVARQVHIAQSAVSKKISLFLKLE